jgi:glycosyltransferase involved in cell wall biosynthesis
MKVLWFTNIPLLTTSGYNGGGWMYSLKDELLKEKEIELGVAYYSDGIQPNEKIDNCSYFHIKINKSLHAKIKRKIFTKLIIEEHIKSYAKIIESFQPDVIHIFGTEMPYGLIANRTNIPVVIHIQCILNSYMNAYFPPGINLRSFLKLNIREYFKQRKRYKEYEIAAKRELNILKICKNYMGRTNWDLACLDTLSSDFNYYHIDETLRDGFYETSCSYEKKCGSEVKIVSTLSDTMYKGVDIVIKTAEILLLNKIEFSWDIVGNINKDNYFLVNHDLNKLRIKLRGVLDERELINTLNSSTIYIHPSYIEGSCNSVAEAQMLGLPTIACDVGGVSYIAQDMLTGMLIPANDIHQLAYRIKLIHSDHKLYSSISKNGLAIAKQRHRKESIIVKVISAYRDMILKKEESNLK